MASVRDHTIDSPIARCDSCGECTLNILLVDHIYDLRQHARRAHFEEPRFGQPILFLIAAPDDDAGTLLGHTPRVGKSKPAVAAGDERGLSA